MLWVLLSTITRHEYPLISTLFYLQQRDPQSYHHLLRLIGKGFPPLLIQHICTHASLVIGTRKRVVLRLKSHEWQSSSGVGFGCRLAGSAHLGLQADGEGWGLRNTSPSHMSPNHIESLGSPQFIHESSPCKITERMYFAPWFQTRCSAYCFSVCCSL